jgi:hypothetical protein
METSNVKEVRQVTKVEQLRSDFIARLQKAKPYVTSQDITEAHYKLKDMRGGGSKYNIIRHLNGEVRNLELAEHLVNFFEVCAEANKVAKEKKQNALPIN